MSKYTAGISYRDSNDDYDTNTINRQDPQHEGIIQVYGDVSLRDRIVDLLNVNDLIIDP